MNSIRACCNVLLGVVVVLFPLAGCSTSFSTSSAEIREKTVERVALKRAAADVAKAHWPAPDRLTMSERLTGFVGSDEGRVTKEDAISVYLQKLTRRPQPVSALVSDARTHVQAAHRLASIAQSTAGSYGARQADVAVIEGAIGDLQRNREIYFATLKELTENDAPRRREVLSVLRSDFNDAIAAMGLAADDLADKISNDRAKAFAGPKVARGQAGAL